MNNVFASLIFALCLVSPAAYCGGKKELEFKFNNSVIFDGPDSYHFQSSILVPVKDAGLVGRQDFLEIGRDGMRPELEPVVIEYRSESDSSYNIIMLIRATGAEVQLGHVTVTKEGLDAGRGRGYAIIESNGISKMKIVKIDRYRTASTGFGCGITGCGFGRTKGSHLLLEFTTEAGEQFCLNEGLIKDRAKYFKGSCRE